MASFEPQDEGLRLVAQRHLQSLRRFANAAQFPRSRPTSHLGRNFASAAVLTRSGSRPRAEVMAGI